LGLGQSIYDNVWSVLGQVIVSKYHIMAGRHIDQIIMCALYGVCRVNKIEAKFKKIIEKYRTQSQATNRVYRNIEITTGGERGDIITFYNKIFIPACESILVSTIQSKEQIIKHEEKVVNSAITGSPVANLKDNSPSLPQSPFLRKTAQSLSKSFLIGQSPSKALTAINASLQTPTNKRRRKLKFDGTDANPESSPTKRSRVDKTPEELAAAEAAVSMFTQDQENSSESC